MKAAVSATCNRSILPFDVHLGGVLPSKFRETNAVIPETMGIYGYIDGKMASGLDSSLQVDDGIPGSLALPVAAWVDTLEDVLFLLGKRCEWERFNALVEQTRRDCPVLSPRLARRPQQALELVDAWPACLAAID